MENRGSEKRREHSRIYVACFLLITMMSLFPLVANAQRITGRIAGIVTDPSGAVVPNVEVAALNELTGLTMKAKTDAAGYYVFPTLQPGTYTLTGEHSGFQKLDRKGVLLSPSEVVRVDLQLVVGSAAETVTVVGQAPLVNSENMAHSTTVDRRQITELPLASSGGRQMFALLHLAAGVVSPDGIAGTSVVVSGAPQNANKVSIDGTSLTVAWTNQWYTDRPIVDELAEVKMQNATYSAESGGLGAISMTTVSGTNKFHGSYIRMWGNPDFNAKGYFSHGAKSQFSASQYSGQLTGPIVKNKAFFSFNYEYGSSKSPSSGGLVTVPTDAARSGNFQGIGSIFDPATTKPAPGGQGYVRDPFPNNQIPQTRFDPVSAKLLGYWPKANQPGITRNFLTDNLPNPYFLSEREQPSFKVDYNLSSRIQIFGRYQHHGGGFVQPDMYGTGADWGYTNNHTDGDVASFGATVTVNPHLVNEFRAGYARQVWNVKGTDAGAQVAQKVGLKGLSAQDSPLINISGVFDTGLGTRGEPTIMTMDSGSFTDSLTYIRGSHLIKGGMFYKFQRDNPWAVGFPNGRFGFTGVFTNQPLVAGPAVGFADFLLGLPQSVFASGGTEFGYRQPAWAGFFQDDIKVRRNLTLNLGLRFERFIGTYEQYGRMANFSPTAINPATKTPGALVFPNQGGQGRSFVPSVNRFSPRLGAAYALNPKTVIRGGFGASRQQMPTYYEGSHLARLVGWVPSKSIETTDQVTPVMRLQDGVPFSLTPPKPTADVGNFNSIWGITTEARTPGTYQWSFSIQRQLPGNLLLESAYIGTRGVDLLFPRDINQVPPNLLGPGDAQSRRPFPQYYGVNLAAADGHSIYHGLQMTFTRRFSQGLTFSAYYTLSKLLDDSSADFGGGAGYMPFQNANNLKAEYALSNNDCSQALNLNGTYEIPQIFQGKVAKYAIKGWQLNWIAQFEKGFPFDLYTSINQNGSLAGRSRPDRLGDGRVSASQRTTERWFDPKAFALPAPYKFGTSGRNVLRSPGLNVWNMSIHKNTYFKTPLNESTNVQFRLETQNTFNHPSWGTPYPIIGAAMQGQIYYTKSSSRTLTLVLRVVF